MTNITMSELESQGGELLPERETLLLNFQWAGVNASNSSMAFNILTQGSAATSTATQTITVGNFSN